MTEKLNLIETIAQNDKFSTFSKFLNSSEAGELLGNEDEFTVFAPTNDAFAKIPEHTLNELFNSDNKEQLRSLLAYHFLSGKLMSKQIAEIRAVKSVSGQEINVDAADGIKVNGSRLRARNIEATNGVIHAIDTVLTPPLPQKQFKFLTGYLESRLFT